jgi:5'(3')-deoxyribonucleotidase
VKIEDIKSNKTSKWVKNAGLCRRLVETTGFIRGLKPIDGAIDAIMELHSSGHDIVFVSNATNCPTSGNEKRDWLKFYFNKIWPDRVPLVLTSDKWRVRGDCLLDDDPKNLVNLLPETKGLLFSKTYNADVFGYDCICGWDDFLNWVKANERISR